MRPMLTIVALTATLAGTATAQGTIAARVRAARDGEVRMQYASRPGTCGDGKETVSYRDAFFGRNVQGFGTWRPLRARPAARDGARGGRRTDRGDGARGRRLGRADGRRDGPRHGERDRRGGVLPFHSCRRSSAARAATRGVSSCRSCSPTASTHLRRCSRSRTTRLADTRRQALQWTGMLGDAKVVPALVAIARGASESGGRSDERRAPPTSIRSATGRKARQRRRGRALVGRGRRGNPGADRPVAHRERRRAAPGGVLARADRRRARASRRARERGQRPRGRARPRARRVRARARRPDRRRLPLAARPLHASTIRASARRSSWGCREDESPEAGRWLLDKARDTNGSTEVRKAAVFWAGQRKATPTKDIGALPLLDERSIKEHTIFVSPQREDDEATDALVGIVRAKDDPDMRRTLLARTEERSARNEADLGAGS